MKKERVAAIAGYVLFVLSFAALVMFTASVFAVIPLVLLLIAVPVSLLSGFITRKYISVSLNVATTATKNTAIAGYLVIKNKSWLPVVKAVCKVRVVNDLTREETFIFVPVSAAPKKEQKQIFLLQSEHCGKLYIEVVSVTLMDYFGMIDVKTAARAGARVTIIPEMFTCDITLNSLNSNSDESPDDRKGDDQTELFALREYRQGDDVRQIHWKLSSKTDVLLIKEGSLNISNSLVLYWDKRNYCTAKSMDAMAEVMASVCQRLADNGIQFDVCWNEADDIEKRSVTDSDSLLTIIPEIVKNAANPECPLPDFSGYGRMIYFSSQPIEEFNQYNSFGFICNEYIDKSDNMTVFTAANYKEELERLEI